MPRVLDETLQKYGLTREKYVADLEDATARAKQRPLRSDGRRNDDDISRAEQQKKDNQ